MCSKVRLVNVCVNGCKRCAPPMLPKRETPISLPLPLPTKITQKWFAQPDIIPFNTNPSDRNEIGAAIARNLYSPP